MLADINRIVSLAELDCVLNAVERNAHFDVRQASFSDQRDWRIENGALSHKTGGFFDVIGLRSERTGEERIALFQPQSALTGLAITRMEDEVYVLVQARIEPGNSSGCQFGPTIQSTPANYLRLHGGKATPYAELFTRYNARCRQLCVTSQMDLGEFYYQKNKSHVYVEVMDPEPAENNFAWVSLKVLRLALKRDNYLNNDLRSLLIMFDWDRFVCGPSALLATDSNFDVIGGVNRVADVGGAWGMTGLSDLQTMEWSEDGGFCLDGVSVAMFRTEAHTREVNSWYQPLMFADGVAQSVLIISGCSRERRVLLSVLQEPGLSGGGAVGPSFVRRHCEQSWDIPAAGKVVRSFTQSDEGGRFYRQETLNQIVEVNDDWVTEESQFWCTLAELKQLFYTSQMVSFQLRAIASVLLAELNPVVLSEDG